VSGNDVAGGNREIRLDFDVPIDVILETGLIAQTVALADYEHWSRTAIECPFRDTPEQEMTKPRDALGAHHHKVGARSLNRRDEIPKRSPLRHDLVNPPAARRERSCGSGELLPGFIPPFSVDPRHFRRHTRSRIGCDQPLRWDMHRIDCSEYCGASAALRCERSQERQRAFRVWRAIVCNDDAAEFAKRSPDDQHRARRAANHTVGHTAGEQPAYGAVAPPAHHDDVRSHPPRFGEDSVNRLAVHQTCDTILPPLRYRA